MKVILKIPLFWLLIGWWLVIPFLLIRWLIGYWKCYVCKKWLWANQEKKVFVERYDRTLGRYVPQTVCTKCTCEGGGE